jgi:hypothetical protein
MKLLRSLAKDRAILRVIIMKNRNHIIVVNQTIIKTLLAFKLEVIQEVLQKLDTILSTGGLIEESDITL